MLQKKEEPTSMKIGPMSGKFLRIFGGPGRRQTTNMEDQEGRYPSTDWLTSVLVLCVPTVVEDLLSLLILGMRVSHVCKYSALNPSMENKITGGSSNLKMENKILVYYFDCKKKIKTLFCATYNSLN